MINILIAIGIAAAFAFLLALLIGYALIAEISTYLDYHN